MNIVQDPWLPFRLKDGTEQVLPIAAISNPKIKDFALPRADFQGAAYQLVIGLLQTVLIPEDELEWHQYYEQSPTAEALQGAFDKAAHAFNTTGVGPLFMQDFDPLQSAKPTKVSSLLIDAPGENGLKLNTDHFVKRGIGAIMSLEMAVIALFTLQINAPSGGQGYRTGLRGGGPLTTLVLPQDENASLWQKLWLNVINDDVERNDPPDLHSADVFPWLAPTKTSEKKGSEIYESDVHPVYRYWAMPRRIRLDVQETEGICQLTGKPAKRVVSSFRTKNLGCNYSGTWTHPLTPYKWNPKKPEEEHLSIKGQPGGITYKEWDTLTFTSSEQGQQCAANVSHYYSLCEGFTDTHGEVPRLWVFGYDMDNMKARCWYSVSMPIFSMSKQCQDDVLLNIKQLQTLASDALRISRTQIKTAWYERPGDAKGDTSYIDAAFWQRTESAFYCAAQQLIANAKAGNAVLTPQQAQTWLTTLRHTAMDLFDEYALSDLGSERSMAKRMKARRTLSGWLYGSKVIKRFIDNHHLNQSEGVA